MLCGAPERALAYIIGPKGVMMVPPPKPASDPRNPARSDATQTTPVNSIIFKPPLRTE
jgi:hypothetical protein